MLVRKSVGILVNGDYRLTVTPAEDRVLELATNLGPAGAFARLIAENNVRILSPILDNGREIAAERTAIYTALVASWAQREQHTFGYDRPFAVVALGGTGRREMTPCSDNDFAFLFEDPLEDNEFLKHLQGQILHRGEFLQEYGFKCEALPFSLSDVPTLDGKQLNSFLDLRAVYDPDNFTEVFRDRIRALYDPFDHFLHLLKFWKSSWEPAIDRTERLDRFDIKNEGLRVFLAGVWTLAGETFQPSWDIYESDQCSPKDHAAYAFLLRIRAFVHLRHPHTPQKAAPGDHAEDVLDFDDFTSFGELLGPEAGELERFSFANGVRARLLSARRRVGRFSRGIIQTALKEGRPIRRGSAIALGLGGLYYRAPKPWTPTSEERSTAAMSLLLASQRYNLDIDPAEVHSTFLDISEWLRPTPELAALFYEERGTLAKSFAFLASTDGAEERLFPGYAKFESSLDGRVMDEKLSLRGALERQKIRILEDYVREGKARLAQAISEARVKDVAKNLSVEVEAALLDADHLAAVKLALKTKRLPVTEDDLKAREDESRPLYERLSTGMSGIPIDHYYEGYLTECGFSEETIALTIFLVKNHRAFRDYVRVSFNTQEQIDRFVVLCQSEAWLRAFYVFTHADQAAWSPSNLASVHQPSGFNGRELYVKAMAKYHPPPPVAEHLVREGFTPDHLDVLEDFQGVFTGAYREVSNRFCYHLIELSENPDKGPLVRTIWDGPSTIIGVAAKDSRGLAAFITGVLAAKGIQLLQAHLFSARRYNLVLDFFHVVLEDRSTGASLAKDLENIIREDPFSEAPDDHTLPKIGGRVTLERWDDGGRYHLQAETADTTSGLIHSLTYQIYKHLRANIFGLSAYTAKGTAYISVYHDLPPDLSLELAQTIVAEKFT